MNIVIDWLNDDDEVVDVTRIADVEAPAAFRGTTFGTNFVMRIDEARSYEQEIALQTRNPYREGASA